MAARVQVIVETKSVGGGVLRGITSEMGALGGVVDELTGKQVNWGNVAQMATTMVIKGLKDAAKATVDYANDVRSLSMLSGESTENTSRFIQVLDDYKISADDALLATKALTKNGHAPSIETLAKLSDQYLSLNSVEEKNEFILKNLGKGGLQWVEVLQKGSAALKEQGAAVNESLILSQQAVDNARMYELALDDWNDAVLALKISIGNELLPVLTDIMHVTDDWARAEELAAAEGKDLWMMGLGQTQAFIELAKAERQLTTETENNTGANGENTLSLEEQAEAIKKVSEANTGLLSLTTSLQSETDRYKTTAAELHEKQDLLRADYVAGKVNAEEYKAKMGELTGAVKANQQAHVDAGNKIMFSLMQQKAAVDGLTDSELANLEQMGVAWGIFDQQTVNAAHTMMETAGIMDEQLGAINDSFTDPISKMTQANEKLHALQNMAGQTWTYYVNIETSGRFPNLPNQNQTGPGTSAGVGYQSGQQTGGTVYAGRPYMVGEGGAEPFIPSQNGRVLGHAESLHALTVGGGGGNTNYFYGPVTLELGADAGGGLMGIRM